MKARSAPAASPPVRSEQEWAYTVSRSRSSSPSSFLRPRFVATIAAASSRARSMSGSAAPGGTAALMATAASIGSPPRGSGQDRPGVHADLVVRLEDIQGVVLAVHELPQHLLQLVDQALVDQHQLGERGHRLLRVGRRVVGPLLGLGRLLAELALDDRVAATGGGVDRLGGDLGRLGWA